MFVSPDATTTRTLIESVMTFVTVHLRMLGTTPTLHVGFVHLFFLLLRSIFDFAATLLGNRMTMGHADLLLRRNRLQRLQREGRRRSRHGS